MFRAQGAASPSAETGRVAEGLGQVTEGETGGGEERKGGQDRGPTSPQSLDYILSERKSHRGPPSEETF